MDEDMILIDTRNAPRLMPGLFQRPGAQRPPVIVQAAPQPVYVQQGAAPSAVVYVRDPATGALVREQAGAMAPPAPTSKLSKLGTGALLDIGAQILAALMPLPAAPPATGDLAKDVRNAQLQDAALGLAWKRHEQIKTIGALLGRLV